MNAHDSHKRALRLLSRVLAIAAVVVLVVGVIVLIGSFSAAANLSYSLIGLQVLGGEVLMNLVTPLLRSILTGAGVLVFLIALVLSLVLYSAARMATFALNQSLRLEQAEQEIRQLKGEASASQG